MPPPPSLKQAMTPFPHSVALDAPLAEAWRVMDQHKVRHLPVTGEGHALAGLITDRDMKAALSLPLDQAAKSGLTVAQVYIPDAYVVDIEAPLAEVLLTMAERHIGSALVTRKGRLAGVFTAVDACRAFGQYLEDTFPRPDGDEAA